MNEIPTRIYKPYSHLENQDRGTTKTLFIKDITSNIATITLKIGSLQRGRIDTSESEHENILGKDSRTPGQRKFSKIKDIQELIKLQCELLANRYNQSHFIHKNVFDTRINTLKTKIDQVLEILDVPLIERDAHQLMFWYNSVRFEPITQESLIVSVDQLRERFMRCFNTPTFIKPVSDASINHEEIDPRFINYVVIHINTMESIFTELYELVYPIGSSILLKKLSNNNPEKLFKDFNLILSLEFMFKRIKPSFDNHGKKIKVVTNQQKALFRSTVDLFPHNRPAEDYKQKVKESPYTEKEMSA